MAVYIVTYDLNKETVRPKIVEEVHKGDWARLSESSYAIDTNETPEEVRARFSRHLDENDFFFVISLRTPWDAWGPPDVIDWLQSRLT